MAHWDFCTLLQWELSWGAKSLLTASAESAGNTLTINHNKTIKINSFGLSKIQSNDSTVHTLVGAVDECLENYILIVHEQNAFFPYLNSLTTMVADMRPLKNRASC